MSPQPQHVIRVMQNMVYMMQTMGEDVSLRFVSCFLTVARDEGVSFKELSVKTGIPTSSLSRMMARYALLNSSNTAPAEEEYFFVVRHDPKERRRKKIFLSPYGQLLCDRLVDLMQQGS